MAWRVITREAADADIRDIATYIAMSNEHAARQFGAELWERLQQLAEIPRIGRSVGEFPELRVTRVSHRFWRYLIFYRLADAETIDVIRVLHGARDIATLICDVPKI